MFIPYENGSILSYLNEKASVNNVKHTEEGSMVDVELSPIDFNKYIDYIWVDNKN